MSKGQQLAAAIVGFALIGIYSWIMMGTSGGGGSWAWILLVAAVVLLVWTARAAAAGKAKGPEA